MKDLEPKILPFYLHFSKVYNTVKIADNFKTKPEHRDEAGSMSALNSNYSPIEKG